MEHTKCKILSKDQLEKHHGNWNKKQPLSRLSQVGKKSRDNNVYDYDNLMRKTKTFLGKHKGKWIRKQTHSRFSHDGKHIKTKQGIRLWQPNEKIKKLVRKKKCLNGTQIMETSKLAQKKQLEEKKKKNHAEFFFEPWLKLPLILSRLMGWYTNWYRLEW